MNQGDTNLMIERAAADATDRLDLWTRLLADWRPRSVLEIGVWRGEFAEAILKACPTIERYYLLDAWRPLPNWNKPLNVSVREFEDARAATMHGTEFAAAKRVELRGTTAEVIGHVADESLDFAYIDGDHTHRGIMIDLLNAWPKVRAGGFIGGDDCTPTPWQHDERFEPTLVYQVASDFAEAKQCEMWLLGFHQFVVQKRPGNYARHDLTGEYSGTELAPHIMPRRTLLQHARRVIARTIKGR